MNGFASQDDEVAVLKEQLASTRAILEYVEKSLEKVTAKWQFQLDRAEDAEARIAELVKAANAVCAFDWSDNDADAARTIDELRSIL